MQNENIEYIRATWSDFVGSVNRFVGADSEAELRKWLCDAAVTVWAQDKPVTAQQAETVSFMSGAAVSEDALRRCFGFPDASKLTEIPEFFSRGCSNGALVDRTVAWDIADVLKIYLEYIVSAGGDISLSEQQLIDDVHKSMEEYCDRNIVINSSPAMFFDPALFSFDKPEAQPDDGGLLARSLKLSTEIKLGGSADVQKSEEKPQEKVEESEAEEDTDTLESVMAELNGLVGLDKVKEDVQSLMNFIKVSKLRQERGMKVPTVSYHLVFTGNPGTGKTTVARMIAKLYKLMGILPKGQLVETDRSGLVAGYLGQTAIKTQEVIDKAMGGVLFVDEAYSLANDAEDSYGKEAIETILKAMEDHRDELVVIVAGYDDLMHKFIDSNPGLSSRFNKYFNFPDYDGEALLKIFQRFCDTNGYTLAEDIFPTLREKFDDMYEHREKHFGNARTIRNLFEHAINDQADRLAQDDDITDQELTDLTAEDISSALEALGQRM